MDDIHQQLIDIKTAWDAITTVPADLTGWGFPNLTKQSISDAIGGMAELSEQIEKKDYKPLPTSKAALVLVLTNLKTYVTSHIPPNPQPHIPGFLPIIEQARTLLRHMHEEADGQTRRAYGAAAERLAFALSRVSDATKIYDDIVNRRDSAITANNEASAAAKSAAESAQRVVTLESESSENLSSINKSVGEIENQKKQADSSIQKIDELVDFVQNLKLELEESQAAQKDIFLEFEEYSEQANAILERTNQASLAGSFITRKRQLKWIQVWWGILFLISRSEERRVGKEGRARWAPDQ